MAPQKPAKNKKQNTTTSRSSSPAAGVHASRRSSTTTSRSSSPAAGLDASRRSTDTEQQVHEWQEHQGRRTRAAQRQRHAADTGTSSQSQLAQSITRRVETSRYTKPARDSEPAVDLTASPRAKRKVGRFCSTFWERDAKNHANFLRVPVT